VDGGRGGREGGARRGERRRSSSTPAASAVRRREHRLRRIVRRLDACLPEIAAAQRRVLVLRAGVGPAPVRSRAQVARRLGVPVARVARLERRGVRTLRRLDRATNCAPGAGPAPAAGGVSVLAGLAAPSFGATTAAALGAGAALHADAAPGGASTGSGDGSTGSGDGSQRASAPARGGVEGATAEQPAAVLPQPPGRDRTAIFVLAGLLVLLGFGLRALRATRT
jgi:hypothetical protein